MPLPGSLLALVSSPSVTNDEKVSVALQCLSVSVSVLAFVCLSVSLFSRAVTGSRNRTRRERHLMFFDDV